MIWIEKGVSKNLSWLNYATLEHVMVRYFSENALRFSTSLDT